MRNKILFIQEFGELVPSGKIRGTIYKSEFENRDIYCKFISRNSEKCIELINNSNYKFLGIIFIIINQFYKYFISIKIIILSKSFQSIWLNKVLSPRFIYLLRLFNPNKIINLDVVDNPYEISLSWINSLKCVSSITTDNLYNQKRIKNYFENVLIIPDYPLLNKFENKLDKNKSDDFSFGWVGSKSSYYLLREIEDEIIQFLNNNKDATFYLLGAPLESRLIKVKGVISIPQYNENIMIEIIRKLHVGLFPLDNSLASEVRGVLKATLYMAGSAVVLANPIGEINDLIKDNYNGMLIQKNNNWFEKLSYLKENRDELLKISKNAYFKLKNNYSLESNFQKILKILDIDVLD